MRNSLQKSVSVVLAVSYILPFSCNLSAQQTTVRQSVGPSLVGSSYASLTSIYFDLVKGVIDNGSLHINLDEFTKQGDLRNFYQIVNPTLEGAISGLQSFDDPAFLARVVGWVDNMAQSLTPPKTPGVDPVPPVPNQDLYLMSTAAIFARTAALLNSNPASSSQYFRQLAACTSKAVDLFNSYRGKISLSPNTRWDESMSYFGIVATELSKLPINTVYRDVAQQVGEAFKARLVKNGTGWIWDRGLGAPAYVADSRTAGAAVRMMGIMLKAGLVFSADDMRRMVLTLTDIIWDGNLFAVGRPYGSFSTTIDGKGAPGANISDGWGMAIVYSHKAEDMAYSLITNLAIQTWNASMLANGYAWYGVELMGDLTQPEAATLLYVSGGDGQSGPVGTVLTIPLAVTAVGPDGYWLADVPVNFTIKSGSASLSATSVKTGVGGVASSTLTLGNVPGKVTVTATTPGVPPIQFTATVLDVPSQLKILSGAGQAGVVASTLPAPLIVQVFGRSTAAINGIPVTFAVAAGTASLSANTVQTGADGTAQVSVTLGRSTGPVSITATVVGLPVASFNLTATPDPGGFLATASYTIDTVAGTYPLGDGGPATQALLLAPKGLAFDADGNLYIAESGQSRIRKVSPDGQIQTVAGGGPANTPGLFAGLATDGQGNLYIADQNTIRLLKPNGIITTIAGIARAGFGGDGGPASAALLSGPSGLAVDSNGSLYIADTGNHRIRRIDASGVIATIAGSGQAGYSGDGGDARQAQITSPLGVTFDASGSLLIAEGSRLRMVTPDGVISTLAGGETSGFEGDGGPARSALLNRPSALAVDRSGVIFIADLNRIRAVSPSGIINTVVGTGFIGSSGDGGPATAARLNLPSALAIDASGSLLIAESNQVRMMAQDGTINTFAGRSHFDGDGGSATSALMLNPLAIALDGSGNLYIADNGNNRVRMVDSSGVITTIAGTGVGGFGGDGGPATSAQLFSPWGLVVDSAGNLYIADTNNQRIRKVTPEGTITTIAGNGRFGFDGDDGPATSASFAFPAGLAIGVDGTIYVADPNNNRIRAITPDGFIHTVAGTGTPGSGGDGGPAAQAQLWFPRGIAVDASGNLYIADPLNRRVRKVTPDGMIGSVAGRGVSVVSGDSSLISPLAVAVDGLGNLYIGDSVRVRRLTPGGVISTIGGGGVSGFAGDGGPALSGLLAVTYGLAVDGKGNLFIADRNNQRIRLLKPLD